MFVGVLLYAFVSALGEAAWVHPGAPKRSAWSRLGTMQDNVVPLFVCPCTDYSKEQLRRKVKDLRKKDKEEAKAQTQAQEQDDDQALEPAQQQAAVRRPRSPSDFVTASYTMRFQSLYARTSAWRQKGARVAQCSRMWR